jgi:hypothetical protein
VPIPENDRHPLWGVSRPLSVQVSYQAGACGETESKRSSSGCTYQSCFKVCNGLRLKHKLLQEGLQEFIGHSDFAGTVEMAEFRELRGTRVRTPPELIELLLDSDDTDRTSGRRHHVSTSATC